MARKPVPEVNAEAMGRDPEESSASARAAAPGAAVWVARLSLTHFRSYEQAVLETTAAPVVLTGVNGAGKTNLLEALSYLAPGRGLRSAKLADVLRRRPAAAAGFETGSDTGSGTGAGGLPAPETAAWAVAAEVVTPDGPRSLGTGGEAAGTEGGTGRKVGRERRVVKIDGAFVRGQQPLGEILALVWLTPQMDGLFREAASDRRRFLDRLIYGFDPEHAGRVSAYEHALRERSRLLKSGTTDAAWLSSLEDTMARYGVAIAAARRAFIERLSRATAVGVGSFPRAQLALAGELETRLGDTPALAVEDQFRDGLAASRVRDAESGGASSGPHRSDFLVHHLAKDMPAALCSTGEQKALLISIVLANARLLTLERGAAPLLLLDEVAAHLDGGRRAALYDEILALGSQAWLTGTEESVFAELAGRAQFFTVRDGGVAPAGRRL